MMSGAYFDIATNKVVSLRGEFDAGAELKFKGSGTATGPAKFPYRIPDWGSTVRFNIGVGYAPGGVVPGTTITINNQTGTLATNNNWTVIGGDGISAVTATNIAETVVAASTNAVVLDSLARVAQEGYLLPASTQSLATVTGVNVFTNFLYSSLTPTVSTQVANKAYVDAATQSLATVSYVDTATNNAIVDVTNRVAGMGYLPIVSTNHATVGSLTLLETNLVSGAVGQLWNDGSTLSYKPDNSGVIQQLGEVERLFFNNTGSTILDGQAVYITGTHGDYITIDLATVDLVAAAVGVIGVATHDITNMTLGWVQHFGDVRGLTTNRVPVDAAVGADLYLNHVPGALCTNVTDAYVGKVARRYGPFADIFVNPHYDATTFDYAAITNAPWLLSASTQDLATVSYVDTATNNAIIDVTNRVAGMGFLTAEADTLATVTARGADTTAHITAGSFGGLSITNALGARNEIVMAPTNNTDLLRVELEPGADVTGMFIGRPGATVPAASGGSYMTFIKAPSSGTYNHALGLEAGKSNGEILHLYNWQDNHIARFNTDSSEELEVRWSRPEGQDQFYWLGGVDPYLTIGTGGLARSGSARVTVDGGITATSFSGGGSGLTGVPADTLAAVLGAGNDGAGLSVTNLGSVTAGAITGGVFTSSEDAIVFLETSADNMGMESVTYPVTGQTNSAWVGYQALSLSPGSFNSAMGYQALRSSPGSFNSAVGYLALRQSPGSHNSAMGYLALRQSPGSHNSAMGYLALYQSPGSYNFAGGYQAGYKSGGTSNVFLGANAGFTTGTGTNYYTNAIAIGAGSVPIGDNSAVLGNADTAITEIKGNLGIGTETPSQRLHVNGSALITSNLFGGGGFITNFIQAGTFTTNAPTAGQIAKYNATAGRWYAADDNAAAGGDPIDARAVTNNINLAGFSITNGTFIGDGSGLTGVAKSATTITINGEAGTLATNNNWTVTGGDGISAATATNIAVAAASNAVNTSSAYNYVLTSAPTVTVSVASASYSLIVTNPTCEIAFDMAIFPTNQMHHPALMLWAGTNVVSADASQVNSNSWEAVDINSSNWTFMVFSKPVYMTNFNVRSELRAP